MSTDNQTMVAKKNLADQFKNLDMNAPGLWPILPKLLLLLGVLVGLLVALWFLWLKDYKTELEASEAKEVSLKEEYKQKIAQAVNLEALKEQKEQVQVFVKQLEKQLPNKSEMAELLSDINQAGLGRSLEFEQFTPKTEVMREYYAELPINIKVTGTYHDMGAFTADVASLSRIVTLNNLQINRPTGKNAQGDTLTMDAVAKTFRYLEEDEIKQAKEAKKK